MGIPIPTAESRAAVGTEFLSQYPPHTHTYEDPYTHGRPVTSSHDQCVGQASGVGKDSTRLCSTTVNTQLSHLGHISRGS